MYLVDHTHGTKLKTLIVKSLSHLRSQPKAIMKRPCLFLMGALIGPIMAVPFLTGPIVDRKQLFSFAISFNNAKNEWSTITAMTAFILSVVEIVCIIM